MAEIADTGGIQRENPGNSSSPGRSRGNPQSSLRMGAIMGIRTFINQFPKPIALLDRQLRYVAVSDSWLRAYALTEGMVLGRPHEEVLPEDYNLWKDAYNRCLSSGTIEHLDYDFSIGPGGCLDAIRWLAAPRYDESGNIEGVLVFSEVVSADLKDNIEVELDRQRLRLVLDTVGDGIIITNSEGMITLINPAASKLLGVLSHEGVGKPVDAYLPLPDSTQEHSLLQRLQWLGEQSDGGGRKFKIWDRAGREKTVELSVKEMRAGNQTDLLLTLRDLTTIEDVQQRLRIHSTALYTAANIIVITDATGKVTWANPSFYRITGYTEEEIIGNSTRILKSGAHEDAFYREMWDTIVSGKVWQGQIINRYKDGSLHHEFTTITPVLNNSGKVAFFVAIKQDVTDQKKQEQEILESHDALQESLLAKSQLLASVGHELRAPLNSLMGYSEMLASFVPEGEERARLALERVHKSGREMLSLMSNIFDLAKTESGKLRITPSEINFYDLVKDILVIAKGVALKKGIVIETSIAPEIPVITADEIKMKQILYNLFSNAIRWSPSGGRLHLKAHVEKAGPQGANHLVFSITDCGPGIENEDRERIFEDFFHKEPPAEMHETTLGHGFGLALTRKLVEMHGGTITADNTTGGKTGARLTVFLPLAPVAEN